MTLVFGLLSPISGLLIDKIGYFIPVCLANCFAITVLLFFARLNIALSMPCLIIALILFGISAPLMGSGSAVACFANLPKKDIGVGMSVFYMLAFLGATIGVAFSGSLLSLISMHNFLTITGRQLNFSREQLMYLQNVVNGSRTANNISSIFPTFSDEQLRFLLYAVKESFIRSMSLVMYVCFCLSIIAQLVLLCKQYSILTIRQLIKQYSAMIRLLLLKILVIK